jgi:hypothetical protein
LLSFRSMRFAHEAQVMPVIGRSAVAMATRPPR